MTFLSSLGYVHRETWLFMFACPLLALVPVVAEFIQHIVEMRIGMYDGSDGALAANGNLVRLYFGFAKVLAISLPGYWVIRYLAGGRDAQAARTVEPRAAKLFGIVYGLGALFAFLGLFVFDNGYVAGGFFVFGLIFQPLIARFVAGAPLGIWISPQASIRAMLPHIVFAVGFAIAAMTPLMIVHYGLGIGAVFAPGEAAKWVLLVLNSFVTGWLAAVIAAAAYVIALRPGGLQS